jgi:choline-glycine betaine transporter
MVIPSLICFLWFSLLGGSALELEITGAAQGLIAEAPIESKMFVTLQQILSPTAALGISLMVVLLILTFLITSVDSGVLVLNTILAEGEDTTGVKHRVIWGAILTLVVGSLMFAGGIDAVQKAMIIGALPFSMIMILMCIAYIKSSIGK